MSTSFFKVVLWYLQKLHCVGHFFIISLAILFIFIKCLLEHAFLSNNGHSPGGNRMQPALEEMNKFKEIYF